MNFLNLERGGGEGRHFLFRQVEKIIDAAADPALEMSVRAEIGIKTQFAVFDDDCGNCFFPDQKFQSVVNRCP